MMGVTEVIKSLILDLAIIAVFYLIVSTYYKRSYRLNLLHLLMQLASMILAGVLSFGITTMLMNRFFSTFDFSSWIPESFSYVLQPYEQYVLPFIIFMILLLWLFPHWGHTLAFSSMSLLQYLHFFITLHHTSNLF